MDIKDLNKSQLILLAVLLSFVTSIATGITTVTLMQQAPVSVTTPINRVVQQTIEKIQQVEGNTTIQTVVVKEEDLIVDVISKNKSAVFSVSTEGRNLNGDNEEINISRGFVISADGVVVADSTYVSKRGNYIVKNNSGVFKAEFLSIDPAGFALLKIGEPVNGEDELSYAVPTFGNLGEMKVGQKIIVIGNEISFFIFNGLNASQSMDINVTASNSGGLVLNLDGDALGMALSSNGASFVSIQTINEALRTFQDSSRKN